MASYLIGDLQGCDASLGGLLQLIDFSPSTDTLYCLGDLINRGPDNVGVLQRLMRLGSSARCILGNHDLHFLAIEKGIRPLKKGDTVHDVLQHPKRSIMVDWLREQGLALHEHELLMVHAGIHPSWHLHQALALAQDIHLALTDKAYVSFLEQMYGNEPDTWHDELSGMEQLRFAVNVFTRMRFCDAMGKLDFKAKATLQDAPAGFYPWFDAPQRRQDQGRIAFGHWSSVGGLHRSDVICLDTGCVWGRSLSAFALAASPTVARPLDRHQEQANTSHLIEGQWHRQASLEPRLSENLD